MKLILLNGPRQSGKDTSAAILEAYIDTFGKYITGIERMSAPLKETLSTLLEVDLDPSGNLPPELEHSKESPHPVFGVSLRQFQIDMSEKFMKPLYGQDIFARLLHHRLKDVFDDDEGEFVFIIPDCGFQVEVDTLAQLIGPERVLLLCIQRPGYDFGPPDSREAVVPHLGVAHDTIDNNADLDHLKTELRDAITTWGQL